MSQQNEPSREIVEALRNDMPPAAAEAALARLRAAAVRKHAGRRTGLRAHPWRTAGGFVTALALIVTLAIALSPRADTSAFAADEAAEALLPQTDGMVLNIVGTYKQTGENDREGHDPRRDIDQRQTYWIDPARNAIRYESVNTADGSLDSVSVQIDDIRMHYQNNVRYGTGDSPRLSKTTGYNESITSIVGGNIDFLRARIAEGTAKATGTELIDGEEYWLVEYKSPVELPVTSFVHTVSMRKSDYRIRSWTSRLKYINLDGRGSMTSSMTYDVIEEVDPTTLPADFFTFESVIAEAGPGVPLEIDEWVEPNLD